MPVTVLGADGTGQDSDVIAGVVWAVDHGADVILMAFSNPGYSPALQAAIDYAWSNDVVARRRDRQRRLAPRPPSRPATAASSASPTPTRPTRLQRVRRNYGQDDVPCRPRRWTSLRPRRAAATPPITGTSASAAEVAAAAALLRANDSVGARTAPSSAGSRESADAAGTAAETGNGRLNLARALADTSTVEVQPAGAPGGGPLVNPYVVSAAQNGDGGMTVSPGTAVAGSTGNSFTFTFTNTNNGGGNAFPANSAMSLDIPAGWTPPQATTSGNPGFVSATAGTCTPGALSVAGSTVTVIHACASGTAFTISYAGGGTKVTAPTVATGYSFVTKSRVGAGGTLTALSSGSPSVTVTAAGANKLAFGTQPSNTAAGSSITPAVTVQIQDQFGNLTTSTANVTLAIGANPGSGTLSGTVTVAAVSGTATFSNLSINKTGTGYTLNASSGALTGATSNTFNITPGAANKWCSRSSRPPPRRRTRSRLP